MIKLKSILKFITTLVFAVIEEKPLYEGLTRQQKFIASAVISNHIRKD